MLTAPRVYFAMAEDGVFFRGVAWVHPRTRVPVVAIVLQGVWAIVIALAGTYAQVVNYVVAMDCIFFGLTAVCLFVLRRRDERSGELPRAGTSGDDAALHRGAVDDRGQHLCARSKTGVHRARHRAGRFADLLSLAQISFVGRALRLPRC